MNLNNPLLLSKSTVMISHGIPDKCAGKGKIAHDTVIFPFPTTFQPFPNDKILGRSKLEVFAKDT